MLLLCLPAAFDGFWLHARRYARCLTSLFCATLGFLWFNRPPARSSRATPAARFWLLFGVRSLQDGFAEPAAPDDLDRAALSLAVPWYDMTAVVLLRLSQGQSLSRRQAASVASLGRSRPERHGQWERFICWQRRAASPRSCWPRFAQSDAMVVAAGGLGMDRVATAALLPHDGRRR